MNGPARRTVLLTGAGGKIGSALLDRLPALGWDVRPFDRAGTPGGIVGDITSPTDLDAAVRGVDAIAHFAGYPTEAPWPVLREANVEGLVQLFEAARRAGVKRVVWASSNHAVGFEPLPDSGELPDALPPRPDTLYGVTKAFGEALAQYYVERYGFQVVSLRIGTFDDRPTHVRTLASWLSPDDAARLVDAALRAPRLTHAVVWGISNNTRRQWSLDGARALGYDPQDDAENWADEIDTAAADPSDRFVGGGYTSAGYGIDEAEARWSTDNA